MMQKELKASLVVAYERLDKVTANGDQVVAKRRFAGLRSDLAQDVMAAIGAAIGNVIEGAYLHTEVSREYIVLN
ncbi:DUF1659 domain-containing protein [Exiguobacterium flavidum]|uniref:DUF1659 domain-containing protein n=1 Tax=Exiguobacterium flavidum TaxID=2184695 RepID=UPI000DF7C50E|nr:DUF1659 domain-containing protein [Exiguobacterium flavidum]